MMVDGTLHTPHGGGIEAQGTIGMGQLQPPAHHKEQGGDCCPDHSGCARSLLMLRGPCPHEAHMLDLQRLRLSRRDGWRAARHLTGRCRTRRAGGRAEAAAAGAHRAGAAGCAGRHRHCLLHRLRRALLLPSYAMSMTCSVCGERMCCALPPTHCSWRTQQAALRSPTAPGTPQAERQQAALRSAEAKLAESNAIVSRMRALTLALDGTDR